VRPDTDCLDISTCWWHRSWAPHWCFLTACSPHSTTEHVHISEGCREISLHHSPWLVLCATEQYTSSRASKI